MGSGFATVSKKDRQQQNELYIDMSPGLVHCLIYGDDMVSLT